MPFGALFLKLFKLRLLILLNYFPLRSLCFDTHWMSTYITCWISNFGTEVLELLGMAWWGRCDSVSSWISLLIIIFNFVFIFQAIACYTPKFLWDAFEGGLLQMIVRGLHLGICREEEKEAKKDMILSYLTSHLKVIFNVSLHRKRRKLNAVYCEKNICSKCIRHLRMRIYDQTCLLHLDQTLGERERERKLYFKCRWFFCMLLTTFINQ